ncbi:MAG: hypothetical protein ABL996_02725 [Micropepsaceae bacterium]
MLHLDIAAFFASATLFGLAGYLEQLAMSRVERPGPGWANLIFTVSGTVGRFAGMAVAFYALISFHWLNALLVAFGSLAAVIALERFVSSAIRPGITFLSFLSGVALFVLAMGTQSSEAPHEAAPFYVSLPLAMVVYVLIMKGGAFLFRTLAVWHISTALGRAAYARGVRDHSVEEGITTPQAADPGALTFDQYLSTYRSRGARGAAAMTLIDLAVFWNKNHESQPEKGYERYASIATAAAKDIGSREWTNGATFVDAQISEQVARGW